MAEKISIHNFITLRTQPTKNSCRSTCVAMLLGVTPNKVIQQFHDAYMNQNAKTTEYLKSNGLNATFCGERAVVKKRGAYICTVPSLNIPKLLHSVVVVIDETGMSLLDPNFHREGIKHYDLEKNEDDPDSEDVLCMVPYLFVSEAEILRFHTERLKKLCL